MVGYEELRRRATRPIGLHHFPLGVTTEMMQHRMGDFYMLGHGLIGTNAKKAGVFEAAKAPFMMQNTGGSITRAMNAHMSSVFTAATFHSVSASEVCAHPAQETALEAARVAASTPLVPDVSFACMNARSLHRGAEQVWGGDVCDPSSYADVINGTVRVTNSPGENSNCYALLVHW